MTNRCLAAVAVLTFASTPATAQQALLGPGAAFIAIGTARISTAELDERLAANAYPTFGQSATSIGIGGYRQLANGILLGAELNGLVIGDERHNGRTVGVGGGHATLGIGYVKTVSNRMRVYPRFGFGAGGIALWFQEDDDTTTFDNVLGDPAPVPAERQQVLSRDGGVFDFGAGAEFRLRDGGTPLIGVRLGYLVSAFGSERSWQTMSGIATNGPPASLSGIYLRLLIGGAWTR